MIASESHVRAATALRAECEYELEQLLDTPEIRELREDIGKLTEAIDEYIVEHYQASDGYEDDNIKLTKVVGHTRRWNPDKLRKLLPTRLYKLVIKVSVDSAKLDELVREGKIERDKIESAFEEMPNAPYVKRTDKTDRKTREDEAAKLQEALG